MVRQVIKVLDLVSRFGSRPSLKIFNSILDVLVKENIDIAREFYRKKMMGSGVDGDDYTFGILMKGLCLTNRIADGFKLLQVMKSRGITPNTVIYNTLLHALCRNGKVGRARTLMNEMVEPNDVTFNVLISGYCAEEKLVQALVLLEKCFTLGFVPDVVTVTKVLEVLCNAGRVAEAVEILERVGSRGGTVDVVAYNTIIKGFCKLGKMKVGIRMVKEMENKGCLPNVDTYNVLISGFCESGMLDSAVDMFNDMKTDGISWNFTTYDTLIRGLCCGGRTKDGYKILELMEESIGVSVGRINPYNSVLYGLYKENRSDEGLVFLTNMEKFFPRAVDRSLKILSSCKEGILEDAKGVYDQMIGEGGAPSVFVYHHLIHEFCKEGCLLEAFELLNQMIVHGHYPIASTFNALISGFCRLGKVGNALRLVEDMVGRGCVPDAGSYNPVVVALCLERDFEKAFRVVLQMVEKGLIPDHFAWNSLLVCLSQQTMWLESKVNATDLQLEDGDMVHENPVLVIVDNFELWTPKIYFLSKAANQQLGINSSLLEDYSTVTFSLHNDNLLFYVGPVNFDLPWKITGTKIVWTLNMGFDHKEASSSSNVLPQFPREDTPLLGKPRHLSSQSKTFANVFIAIVGSGVLGLPYTFKKTGWVFGSLMVFSVAFFTYYCMMLLVRTRRKLDSLVGYSKINSFGDLGFAVCGSFGRLSVDAMIILGQVGFCVSYLIFISTTLAYLFNDSSEVRTLGLTPKSLYLWGCFPFQLGLNAIPTLTHLAPLSIFADVVDVGAMGVVMVEDVIIFLKQRPALQAFGASLFSFTVWVNKDIITTNFGQGLLSTVVQLGLCINLFFTLPLMMNPVYEVVERRFCNSRYCLWLRWIIMLGVSLVALMVPNFADFLSLVGSSVCVVLGFVLPALFHWLAFKEELSWQAVLLDGIIVVLAVIIAVTGTWTSLVEIFAPMPENLGFY
ncbi:hypothetical protein FNV43_RR18538 [Rhamnella rubrinervis]|uniref:Amino acid transporter transmembrane domain-containing protein n=1 Tax=Rhamnella rubrinervis TaxID=2594499 RepID=A0A8K0E6G3_9ROSA|nr:hypothetical protein FNV43_RR18538 [Rhamnella rubrinervis]